MADNTLKTRPSLTVEKDIKFCTCKTFEKHCKDSSDVNIQLLGIHSVMLGNFY